MHSIDSGLLFWSLPACYAVGGLAALFLRPVRRGWACALALATAAGALCLALLAVYMIRFVGGGHPADPAGALMAGLLALLGWVIVRYSRNYLRGERGQTGYLVALMFTLTAVGIVVLAHNLAAILLAWASSSLALHRLLTFYPERPRALLAAHKKFIVSRLAELCIVGALALFYVAAHSLSLDTINALAHGASTGGWKVQGAVTLVAAAVILKAAQLPFHGWLIQVMEAPTPVSALLHAGVVNIGGFILIRLAPLLNEAFAAQALLVGAGTLTACLAGLAMMTRGDIKSRLAWSTCAQMGFMLLECGLGLLPLALLHLIAHSFFKAYGFLSYGDTVRRSVQAGLAQPARFLAPAWRLALGILAAPLALALAFGLARTAAVTISEPPVHAVALLIVGLACAPLLREALPAGPVAVVRALVLQALIVLAYLLWHGLFYRLPVVPAAAPHAALALTVAAAFSLVYLTQTAVQALPEARLIRRLQAWTYAGFYLDEAFNRLTQEIWPLHRTLQATAAMPFPNNRAPQGESR